MPIIEGVDGWRTLSHHRQWKEEMRGCLINTGYRNQGRQGPSTHFPVDTTRLSCAVFWYKAPRILSPSNISPCTVQILPDQSVSIADTLSKVFLYCWCYSLFFTILCTQGVQRLEQRTSADSKWSSGQTCLQKSSHGFESRYDKVFLFGNFLQG